MGNKFKKTYYNNQAKDQKLVFVRAEF